MEKIVAIYEDKYKNSNNASEVNKYLEDGWRVKHIAPCPVKGALEFHSVTYVVLEK